MTTKREMRTKKSTGLGRRDSIHTYGIEKRQPSKADLREMLARALENTGAQQSASGSLAQQRAPRPQS